MLNLSHSKPLCIAHRGASSLAPENTLAAAAKALAIGADVWELDVSVTADGRLVVLHDDSLARTSNAPALFPERNPWLVSTFTLAEIKQLDAGSWFVATDPFGTIAGGAVTSAEAAAFTGQRIPTLEEALLFTRQHHWRVNVEIKPLTPPLENFPVVAQVLALIEALEMVNQVLLSSFSHPLLLEAKQRNPHIAVAALIDEGEAWPSQLRYYDALHPHAASVQPENTGRVRQAGLAVNPWTVNDPLEMQRLIQAGVTGMFTDFPHILKQVIG